MTITLNGSNGETFPNWTTATRPASPSAGQTGFNTTTGQMETYNGTAWTVYTAATTQGTSGQPLLSSGAGSAPTFGTLGTSAGGTGLTTVGTNGQVLQSNGSTLSWATPASGGAMTLISTQTASSSSQLTWTALSGYDSYNLSFYNITTSGAGQQIAIQFGTGAGPTYVTSGYYEQLLSGQNATVATSSTSTATRIIPIANVAGLDTAVGGSGFLTISGFLSGKVNWVGEGYSYNLNSEINLFGGFLNTSSAAVTAIKIYMVNGSFTFSGKFSLYGISS